MQLTREDIVLAAEETGLREDDYMIRNDYKDSVGVSLEPEHLISFMVSLALVLAENGRADDAQKLAEKSNTETQGMQFTVYWPGVELAD